MLNLEKDKNYLLACSHGPDSMALFDMLLKDGYHFSAALVNYHLRPESGDEMNNFIHYCVEHKISYHIKDIVKGIVGVNLEAECRRIRYEFFAQLVDTFKYDAVLVAHNQDDHIETYLMQKKRQNLVTFYGIQEKTTINGVTIIRPLLGYTKNELLNYCHDNNVPFSLDSTNTDERYLRNKIRHQVVAKMTVEERQDVLKEIDNKNEELRVIIEGLKGLDLTDVSALNKMDLIQLAYALNLLVKAYNHSISVSLRQVKEIGLILRRKIANVDIPLKKGIVLRKSYSRVEVVSPSKVAYAYVITNPSIFDCEYFYLDFTGNTNNRNVSKDDYPLTIRTYHRGDKYKIKDYSVSVRRLFIDWKMPLSLRQRWPIILNNEGKIIYIPRYQKDFVPDKETNFYVK